MNKKDIRKRLEDGTWVESPTDKNLPNPFVEETKILKEDMSTEEIMQKIVNKAYNNGWKDFADMIDETNWNEIDFDEESFSFSTICGNVVSLESIIFNIGFAKAFFGEEMYINYHLGIAYQIPDWQLHLQQMVSINNKMKIDYLIWVFNTNRKVIYAKN